MRTLLALSLALFVSACAAPQSRPVTSPDAQSATAKPKITAVQVLGKSQYWVLEHLGEPAFMRTDMHATIWQYKNSHCVLNVFLYVGEPTDPTPAKVLHFDARDSLGDNTDRDACLSALRD